MKQVLVQLDDWLADELEKVAPARSHKRSAFIRTAIIRAIHGEVERATREAYRQWPDDAVVPFDPREWAPSSEALHPDEPETATATKPKRVPKRSPLLARPKDTQKGTRATAGKER